MNSAQIGFIVGGIFSLFVYALAFIMGLSISVKHSMKDEPETLRQCPCCDHVSTVFTRDAFGYYFYCQNPRCQVEKIYDANTVEVSGSSKEGK